MWWCTTSSLLCIDWELGNWNWNDSSELNVEISILVVMQWRFSVFATSGLMMSRCDLSLIPPLFSLWQSLSCCTFLHFQVIVFSNWWRIALYQLFLVMHCCHTYEFDHIDGLQLSLLMLLMSVHLGWLSLYIECIVFFIVRSLWTADIPYIINVYPKFGLIVKHLNW